MYKQHRPRLSGSTLFAIPIIFIFILCIYIIKMSLHIKGMYKQGIPKPAPSAISPIAMLLHHHNGPLYWDRSCIHYQNGPCIGTEVYAQITSTGTRVPKNEWTVKQSCWDIKAGFTPHQGIVKEMNISIANKLCKYTTLLLHVIELYLVPWSISWYKTDV